MRIMAMKMDSSGTLIDTIGDGATAPQAGNKRLH